MASIKFGNIVVAMAGKIAGNIYSRNKGGAYSRTWVKPTNPRTTKQLAVRNTLSGLSQAWRGLTQAARDAWAAATANFTTTNRMAETIKLSGNALYVSLNKNLADVNIAAINVAPAPASVGYLTSLIPTADNSSNSLSLAIVGIDLTNTAFKVFATPSLSAGKASAGTDYRQIGYTAANPTTPFVATTLYNDTFGPIGGVGTKIFVKLVPVNTLTGQMGTAIEAVAVVVV